jgi:HlyD family secretion protein
MRTIVALLIGVILGGASLFAVGFRRTTDESGQQGSSEEHSTERVIALGRIMPSGGVLSIPLPPTDRVQSVAVQEGAQVTQGAVLAVLHSKTMLQREVEVAQSMLDDAKEKWTVDLKLAKTQMAKAQLAVEQIDGGAATEDRAMDESVAALELAVQQQKKDLDRLSGLSRDVVSEQQLEHQKLLLQKSTVEHRSAVAANELNRDQRKFRLRAAQADVDAANVSHSSLEKANDFQLLKTRLLQTNQRLDDATIRAPVSGTVLRIFVRAGEAGGQKPLLQMANLDELEVVAEVFQTDVPRVQIGGTAKIRSDAWGDEELEGKVGDADMMVSTPEMRSLDPLSPADRHVIRIPVKLSAKSKSLASNWLQMQVDVILPVKP